MSGVEGRWEDGEVRGRGEGRDREEGGEGKGGEVGRGGGEEKGGTRRREGRGGRGGGEGKGRGEGRDKEGGEGREAVWVEPVVCCEACVKVKVVLTQLFGNYTNIPLFTVLPLYTPKSHSNFSSIWVCVHAGSLS